MPDLQRKSDGSSAGSPGRQPVSPARAPAAPPPEPPADQDLCPICGATMFGAHCKLICPNCGYREDCSDLFPRTR
jgi:hypothetical protein